VKVLDKRNRGDVANIRRALRWVAEQDVRMVIIGFGVPRTEDDSVCHTVQDISSKHQTLITIAPPSDDLTVPMCPAAVGSKGGVLSDRQVGGPRRVPWTGR